MKLFVAKLNREAVESDLLEWFGAMGPVKSAKVVMDRDTGQSKCFGFVEMESREGGERAIAEMNGQEFKGFRMVVKEAEDRGGRPAPTRGPASDRSPGRGQGDRVEAPGRDRPSGSSPSAGGGGSFSQDKKSTQKKKSQRQKPDKYSDGPRTTKMKKTRGGGGAKEWGGFDEDY